jgi:hypothetical protein
LQRGQIVPILTDMLSPALTDAEVIAKLGGPALVAEKLEYTEWAVKKWLQRDRGIPWKDRPKVAKLASAKRVKLPADFLQERRPPQDAAA